MSNERINVTRSSMPPFEEYIEELKPVWDSRWLSNRGAASIKFEEMLKEYLSVEEVGGKDLHHQFRIDRKSDNGKNGRHRRDPCIRLPL